jgi:hypothetical protein
MARSASTRGNLELPHGETGRAVGLADQASHPHARSPVGLDEGLLNSLVMDDLHGEINRAKG